MGVTRSAAGFRPCPSMGEKASGSPDYRKACKIGNKDNNYTIDVQVTET